MEDAERLERLTLELLESRKMVQELVAAARRQQKRLRKAEARGASEKARADRYAALLRCRHTALTVAAVEDGAPLDAVSMPMPHSDEEEEGEHDMEEAGPASDDVASVAEGLLDQTLIGRPPSRRPSRDAPTAPPTALPPIPPPTPPPAAPPAAPLPPVLPRPLLRTSAPLIDGFAVFGAAQEPSAAIMSDADATEQRLTRTALLSHSAPKVLVQAHPGRRRRVASPRRAPPIAPWLSGSPDSPFEMFAFPHNVAPRSVGWVAEKALARHGRAAIDARRCNRAPTAQLPRPLQQAIDGAIRALPAVPLLPRASLSVLKMELRIAVATGAPLWNGGDQRGCVVLYIAAASKRQRSDARIHAALAAARVAKNLNEAGWILRRAFDAVANSTAIVPLPRAIIAALDDAARAKAWLFWSDLPDQHFRAGVVEGDDAAAAAAAAATVAEEEEEEEETEAEAERAAATAAGGRRGSSGGQGRGGAPPGSRRMYAVCVRLAWLRLVRCCRPAVAATDDDAPPPSEWEGAFLVEQPLVVTLFSRHPFIALFDAALCAAADATVETIVRAVITKQLNALALATANDRELDADELITSKDVGVLLAQAMLDATLDRLGALRVPRTIVVAGRSRSGSERGRSGASRLIFDCRPSSQLNVAKRAALRDAEDMLGLSHREPRVDFSDPDARIVVVDATLSDRRRGSSDALADQKDDADALQSVRSIGEQTRDARAKHLLEWGVPKLLAALSIENILLVLGCALREAKIIFVSSSATRLSAATVSLLGFMRPLEYVCPVCPIISKQMEFYVGCPTPAIMGARCASASQFRAQGSAGRVLDKSQKRTWWCVVDIDADHLYFSRPVSMDFASFKLPRAGFLAWQLRALATREAEAAAAAAAAAAASVAAAATTVAAESKPQEPRHRRQSPIDLSHDPSTSPLALALALPRSRSAKQRDLACDIRERLVKDRRYIGQLYEKVFVGSEAVDYLVGKEGGAKFGFEGQRGAAIEAMRGLQEDGFFHHPRMPRERLRAAVRALIVREPSKTKDIFDDADLYYRFACDEVTGAFDDKAAAAGAAKMASAQTSRGSGGVGVAQTTAVPSDLAQMFAGAAEERASSSLTPHGAAGASSAFAAPAAASASAAAAAAAAASKVVTLPPQLVIQVIRSHVESLLHEATALQAATAEAERILESDERGLLASGSSVPPHSPPPSASARTERGPFDTPSPATRRRARVGSAFGAQERGFIAELSETQMFRVWETARADDAERSQRRTTSRKNISDVIRRWETRTTIDMAVSASGGEGTNDGGGTGGNSNDCDTGASRSPPVASVDVGGEEDWFSSDDDGADDEGGEQGLGAFAYRPPPPSRATSNVDNDPQLLEPPPQLLRQRSAPTNSFRLAQRLGSLPVTTTTTLAEASDSGSVTVDGLEGEALGSVDGVGARPRSIARSRSAGVLDRLSGISFADLC